MLSVQIGAQQKLFVLFLFFALPSDVCIRHVKDNFPCGKLGKRERVRHQAHILVEAYCKRVTYQDGTLSVEHEDVCRYDVAFIWGAAPYPATFEKVDQTFGCMSFVAVYISPAIKENLL